MGWLAFYLQILSSNPTPYPGAMKRILPVTLLLLAGLATGPVIRVQAQVPHAAAARTSLPSMLSNDLTSVRNFAETDQIWTGTPQLSSVRQHALVKAYFAEYRRLSAVITQACQVARQNPQQLRHWRSFADELERSWDPLEALRVQQLQSPAQALPALRKGYQQICLLRHRTESQLARMASAGTVATR